MAHSSQKEFGQIFLESAAVFVLISTVLIVVARYAGLQVPDQDVLVFNIAPTYTKAVYSEVIDPNSDPLSVEVVRTKALLPQLNFAPNDTFYTYFSPLVSPDETLRAYFRYRNDGRGEFSDVVLQRLHENPQVIFKGSLRNAEVSAMALSSGEKYLAIGINQGPQEVQIVMIEVSRGKIIYTVGPLTGMTFSGLEWATTEEVQNLAQPIPTEIAEKP